MQERLIREMVQLRGGPKRLRVLAEDYLKNIQRLQEELEKLTHLRALIIKLTAVSDAEEQDGSGEEEK